MTWDEVCAMPTREFLDWYHRNYCDRVKGVVDSFGWLYRVGDYEEAWQEVLLRVYSNAWQADRWECETHLMGWSVLKVQRLLYYQYSHKSTHEKMRRLAPGYGILFSELAQEELDRIAMHPVVEREGRPDQLGPSEGWLTKAMDDLTPRRRRAIELCVFNDLTVNQAAELVGVKPDAMCKARRIGLDCLRYAAQGVPYKVFKGGRVVADDEAVAARQTG